MKPPKAMAKNSYKRGRENPYFAGLLRGSDSSSQNISRSTSDIGDMRSKSFPDISGKSMDLPVKDSVPDIVEPFEQTTIGTILSKIPRSTSFEFQSHESDWCFDLGGTDYIVQEPNSDIFETTGEHQIVPVISRPIAEKSFALSKRKSNLSKIPIPQSAAAFYNGSSPLFEIMESCDSTMRLNLYLKARKDDVSAGVPGKFLHAVIGQDVSDVGSFTSVIMYAFYLNETLESDQFCSVPIINIKRADLSSHAELKWLLDSCHIDESSLIFVDEIDLSYYDLFGCLKLVLLNGHKLPNRQEALKEAVIEVFNCRKGDFYPWVETITLGQDCSSCTLIAEKFFLTSPQLLAGQGFSRLLLAGILMDTGNLTSPHCTTKDKYMATLLLNGAGRFGSNGLYQIVRYKMYDISDLKVVDILRKDFKKWTRVGKPDATGSRLMMSNTGMSSIGISIEQFLAHEHYSTEEIKYFKQLEKLRLLMIVSGYYDAEKNFKREILVSAESMEHMTNLLSFFSQNASHLPLKALNQPGLRDGMKAFEIDQVTSRKTIERLLEEFGGASKG